MKSFAYYQQKLYIAQVDEKNNVIGKVERWQAHKKAVLHLGYTVVLTYKNQFVIQHRKHLVFNKYYDLSFSSHQIYKNQNLQTDLEAIYEGLEREWNIFKKDLIGIPKKKGQIYYKVKDPISVFSEHEIDIIYQADLKYLPNPNLDYCFGFELIDKEIFISGKSTFTKLAPWVFVLLKEKLIK